MSDQPTNLRDRLIKGGPGYLEELTNGQSKYRNLKYSQFKTANSPNPEPFITTPLPGVTEDNPNLGLLGNGDFILRAGSLSRTAEDVSRLGKFFTTPQGLGFAAKQNLLSAQNVKLQGGGILNQGAYLPTNTLAQAGVSALGGHLVKQGINPFRDLSVEPFQIPQVEGDGFLAKAANTVTTALSNANRATTFPLYLQNVSSNQESTANRLVELRDKKISRPSPAPQGGALSFLDNLLGSRVRNAVDSFRNISDLISGDSTNDVSGDVNQILKYNGGPGSFQGIGSTVIKRYSDTNAYDTEEFRQRYYLLSAGQLQTRGDTNKSTPTKILSDFRGELTAQQEAGEKKNILSVPVDYTTENIERRVGLGDPGTPEKNLSSYVNGSGIGPVDQVNSLPLYEARGVTANPRKNDLVKFRISAPDTANPRKKTYIHFRAFIDGFVDNFNSSWTPVNYMGRTDSLFRFQNYSRSVVMSWTIAAQSREEMMVMYTKLNYLQSLMAGDYTEKGYMAGNLINLTVGGYFWEMPCKIDSMNITIPNESPWEIGIPDSAETTSRNSGQFIDTDKSIREMPHIIQVTGFSFTPLHEFAPRKQKNVYNKGGVLSEFGKERFISLQSETGKSIYDQSDSGNVRNDLQFNPSGLVDSSKPLNAIQPRGLTTNATLGNTIETPPTSEISRKLQGLGF